MHSDTDVTKKNNNNNGCTILLVHLILHPLSSSSLPLSLLLCLPHVVSTPHSDDAQSSPVGHATRYQGVECLGQNVQYVSVLPPSLPPSLS